MKVFSEFKSMAERAGDRGIRSISAGSSSRNSTRNNDLSLCGTNERVVRSYDIKNTLNNPSEETSLGCGGCPHISL
jgi:hypothetical protein